MGRASAGAARVTVLVPPRVSYPVCRVAVTFDLDFERPFGGQGHMLGVSLFSLHVHVKFWAEHPAYTRTHVGQTSFIDDDESCSRRKQKKMLAAHPAAVPSVRCARV